MKHLISILLLLSGALFANNCIEWADASADIILDMSEAQTDEDVILLYSEFTFASQRAIEECSYNEEATIKLENISKDIAKYMKENYNVK